MPELATYNQCYKSKQGDAPIENLNKNQNKFSGKHTTGVPKEIGRFYET